MHTFVCLKFKLKYFFLLLCLQALEYGIRILITCESRSGMPWLFFKTDLSKYVILSFISLNKFNKYPL